MPSLSEKPPQCRVAHPCSLQVTAARAGVSLRTLKRLFEEHADFPDNLLTRTKGGHRRLRDENVANWAVVAAAYWRLLSRRSARHRSRGSLGTLEELLFETTLLETARVHSIGRDSYARLSWALKNPQRFVEQHSRIKHALIAQLSGSSPHTIRLELAKLLLVIGENRRQQHSEIEPLTRSYRTLARLLNCSIGALRGEYFGTARRTVAWRCGAEVDVVETRLHEIAEEEVSIVESGAPWKSVSEIMAHHSLSKECAEEVARQMRAIADDADEDSPDAHDECALIYPGYGTAAATLSREDSRSPAVRSAQRRRRAAEKARLRNEVMLQWRRGWRAPMQALSLVRISEWHALNKYPVNHRLPRDTRRVAFDERRRAGWIQTWATVERTPDGWRWRPSLPRVSFESVEQFATMAEAKRSAEKWLDTNIRLFGGLVFAEPPELNGRKRFEHIRLPSHS